MKPILEKLYSKNQQELDKYLKQSERAEGAYVDLDLALAELEMCDARTCDKTDRIKEKIKSAVDRIRMEGYMVGVKFGVRLVAEAFLTEEDL